MDYREDRSLFGMRHTQGQPDCLTANHRGDSEQGFTSSATCWRPPAFGTQRLLDPGRDGRQVPPHLEYPTRVLLDTGISVRLVQPA